MNDKPAPPFGGAENKVSVMKKFSRAAAILAALILAVSLSGCAQARAEAGLYTCTAISTDGESAEPSALYSAPPTLELKGSGKAVLTLGTDSYNGKWFLEDGVFDLVTSGGVSHGSLSGGVITLDLLDSGLVLTFASGGADSAGEDASGSVNEQTALQSAWNGDWYGWWALSNAEGDWADLDGQLYDCFAKINIDENGVGTLIIWDEQMSLSMPMAEVNIEVSAPDGGAGTARSTGGYFWLAALDEGEWQLDPTAYGFENMLAVTDGKYESDEGSFDYQLVLRPWGTVWDDVALSAPELLPYYYESWYLPAIEAGEDMPDSPDLSAAVADNGSADGTEEEE